MINGFAQAIINHAKLDYPREACGLLVRLDAGMLEYWPCRNVSEDPNQFALAAEDYARAEDLGKVEGVVHSHCDRPAQASPADLAACEVSGLPWYIVSIPALEWCRIAPTGYRAPLIGREFVHGIFDCYSLVRDWYEEELVIALPDFPREHKWWEKGKDLLMQNFRSAGFSPLETKEVATDELARGDVLIMQIGSRVPNHAAIYLGSDLILHHLSGRLSKREVYGEFWRNRTRLAIRHSDRDGDQ